MTLKSMTGFGRAEGAEGDVTWHWELRSVNGKGLDIRVRMPAGYEELETLIRKSASTQFKRGNCTFNLNVKREQGAVQVQLNEQVFGQVLKASKRAAELAEQEPPDISALLAMRGVLETVEIEEEEKERKARLLDMQVSFEKALEAVISARLREGAHLADIVGEQVDRIEGLTQQITKLPSRQADFIKERLRESLARIMDEAKSLDEDRLYQEAALLAQKGDVEEELKRLEAHVAEARGFLQSGEPVGRQLDFLAQEFNREANTLCSKSNNTEMTKLGLELKGVIEQLREQIQNIE